MLPLGPCCGVIAGKLGVPQLLEVAPTRCPTHVDNNLTVEHFSSIGLD